MTHCTDRLSDYLDGELTAGERAQVEAHLAACGACAADLEALQAIASGARRLPAERALASDGWPALRDRLQPRGRVWPWRVTLSLPQLAAAAVLLLAVGMGSMWLLLPRSPGDPADAPLASASRIPDAVPVALGNESYDAAIADLEGALEAGRGRLDPETLRVLEENLAAIDAAIAQARAALDADPANAGLTNHLLRTRAMRLGLLRRAVAATG